MPKTEPSLPAFNRRHALLTGGGLAAFMAVPRAALADTGSADAAAKTTAAGAKALPPYATWKDADQMIVHSANTIELKRAAFGQAALTPLNRLYVRNNLNPPSEDIVKNPDAWEMEIEGVAKPGRLTVAELKRIGLAARTMVLQCSGNGRAYFPHKPSGTQWHEGAAGCVEFVGVSVKQLVEARGGLAAGRKYMTGTGGEVIPEGIDPKTVMVERSVPIEETLEHAILAWQLNGVPIPLANGGPLRLVVPGFMGVNNIKYIKRLAFTEAQSLAKIQQTSYRLTPVGTKGAPDFPSLWHIPVNSWITSPYGLDQPLAAGRVVLAGVAFGGTNAVEKIEVSVDGGAHWHAAHWIGPDMGPFAWRNFVLEADLKPGKHHIASRATNKKGETQPKERKENERGYDNNSWLDRSFELEVA